MSTPAQELPLFSDQTLSRRLEGAEGRSNAEFVAAKASALPESGAQSIKVAGAYVVYDGATSPLTQTLGLGLFGAVTNVAMDVIEEFFKQRGAPVFHEVSPLADPALLTLLTERGYLPIEFTSVMHRPIRSDLRLAASRNGRIRVRQIKDGEEELWAQTAAQGWSDFADLANLMWEIGRVNVTKANAPLFLAELDGEPIATGSLNICDRVALFAGASTIKKKRRLGAQLALLDDRLRYAAEAGCDIAMMCAPPGGSSQRNAERHGFQIAYTRIKWHLAADPGRKRRRVGNLSSPQLGD